MFRPLSAAFILGLAIATPAAAQDKTMIVLDSSGSMWGQIDGKAKVEIARETLAEVLGETDSQTLGLMAYGHREKGNCSDIELLVPAAPGSGAAISTAANAIRPLGKTPLSASVQQAAEALKYTEDKATVVLITDGLETCNADPCALGTALEEAGVDFTAHVVGFGLSAEEGKLVSCLAENTGGQYIQASNAAELTGALTQTVAAAPEPEPAAEPIPVPEATLSAPPEAPIASRVTVGWVGPGEPYDGVQLFDPAAINGEGKVLRSYSVRNGDMEAQSVLITMPADPGSYELRYYYGTTRDIIATLAIEATPAEVTLSAPDRAAIAATVTVGWEGPGAEYDEVQLFDSAARGGEGEVLQASRVRNGDFEARTVSIVLPPRPETYELRYFNGTDRKVLATRAITVVDAPVTLEADDQAPAASTVQVDWIGPGADYDEVQLWDPAGNNGEGKNIDNARVRNGDFDNQRVAIVLPAEPGMLELRYYNGQYRMVLATRPIEAMPVETTLDAPDTAPAASTITVTWEGPGAGYDEVQLWDMAAMNGEGKRIDSTRVRNGDFDNRTVKLTMPAKPGPYELQYFNGDSRVVLATRAIEGTPVETTLDAPDTAPAASTITVTWEGPGAGYDEVQLWDMAAMNGEGKRIDSTRVRNGDFDNRTVKLTMPAKPGPYELQYFNGDSRVVLATRAIEGTPVETTLDAPDTAPAASTITVTWEGPGAAYDEVQLWDMAARNGEGDKIAGTRVRNGDFDNRTVKLTMPAQPGTYELQYFNGDSRVVLATRAIEATPVETSLTAQEEIGQGMTLEVTWEGPGAAYDEVQLWDMAARNGEGENLRGTRVRNGDFDNRSVDLTVPAQPGDYVLKYYNGDSRVMLAERPIKVNPVTISLSAPDELSAGSSFPVTWEGPGAQYDEVQIYDAGADKVLNARRVRNGDFDARSVMVDAPDAPGDYVLRYYNGDSRVVLFELPISLQ